jgi:mRNA-degrading endonuclease RelE of RelBE toxin-antitoxin system
MATVFATSRYERDAKRLLTQQERSMLRDAIASNPERHPVIPGTGGVRKARWSRRDKGKSGGVRVIYYHWRCGGTEACQRKEQALLRRHPSRRS